MDKKNFYKLLSGTVISSLGSFAFNYGFISYIYFFTDQDKRFVGLVQLIFVLGMLSGNLFSNKVATRFNKKRAIIIIELLRVPFMLAMILASQSLVPLLILHGAKTFFAGVSTPIRRAFINDLVGKESINWANTVFTTVYALIQVLSPLIGTWIYSIFHNITYLVLGNVAAFIIAATLYLFIQYKESEKVKTAIESSPVFNDIKEGISYIKKRSDLVAVFSLNGISGLITGVSVPLILPFVVEVLKMDEKAFGLMMLTFGVGGIIGGVLNALNKIPFSLGQIIYKSCLLEAVLMFFWAIGLHPAISFGAIFFWGAIFFIRTPSFLNYFSQKVEKEFLVRSHSLIDINFTLFNALAALFVSLSGKSIDTGLFLMGCAVVYGFILLTLYRSKSITALREAQ
jgi:MFS family permease